MSNLHPTPAIEARGLVKTFGTTTAVDGLDLEVPAGSVYGVLGPNGAGKTTTIRMLTTLLPPDAGTARVFGHDIVAESDAVRSRMGLMGQFGSVDQDLTGQENLILIGRLLGFPRSAARRRAADMLEAFGLSEAGDRQVRKYSGGMRRRLDVAATLVTTPDLIFLDEPTTGLDPHSRNEVWDLVRAVVQEGTTVLLTTQYLEEADQLADRIAIIDRGKVIAEGTTGELKSSIGTGRLRVRLHNADRRDEAGEILSRELEVRTVAASDGVSLTASVPAQAPTTRALNELTRAGLELVAFDLGEPSLDEVFLSLTGRPPTTAPTEGHETKEPA